MQIDSKSTTTARVVSTHLQPSVVSGHDPLTNSVRFLSNELRGCASQGRGGGRAVVGGVHIIS
jgi:hypothetical protein